MTCHSFKKNDQVKSTPTRQFARHVRHGEKTIAILLRVLDEEQGGECKAACESALSCLRSTIRTKCAFAGAGCTESLLAVHLGNRASALRKLRYERAIKRRREMKKVCVCMSVPFELLFLLYTGLCGLCACVTHVFPISFVSLCGMSSELKHCFSFSCLFRIFYTIPRLLLLSNLSDSLVDASVAVKVFQPIVPCFILSSGVLLCRLQYLSIVHLSTLISNFFDIH